MTADNLIQYIERFQEQPNSDLANELDRLRKLRLALVVRLANGEMEELEMQSKLSELNLMARSIVILQKQRTVLLKLGAWF